MPAVIAHRKARRKHQQQLDELFRARRDDACGRARASRGSGNGVERVAVVPVTTLSSSLALEQFLDGHADLRFTLEAEPSFFAFSRSFAMSYAFAGSGMYFTSSESFGTCAR